MNYTIWTPGRKQTLPTFMIDEDCVRMDMGQGGQWEDVTCSHDHGYVCEFGGTALTLYIKFKLKYLKEIVLCTKIQKRTNPTHINSTNTIIYDIHTM